MSSSRLDNLTVRTLDAVDIELDLAGLGSRSYAYLIDWHIRIAAAMAWFLLATLIADALGMAGFDWDELGSARFFFVVLPAALIYGLYHPVLEVVMAGRTPGKRIAGIRIVAADGGPATVAGLLIRNIFRLLDGLPGFYGVGIVSMLLTKRQLRVGDIAGGTLLIHSEESAAVEPAVVTGSTAMNLRQHDLAEELLARWFELEPDARYALARQLLAGSSDAEVRVQADSLPDEALRGCLQRLSGSATA